MWWAGFRGECELGHRSPQGAADEDLVHPVADSGGDLLVRCVVEGVGEPSEVAFPLRFEDGEEQVTLVMEVGVERATGEAGAPSDFVDGRVVVPVLREQLGSCDQQRCACLRLLISP